MNRINIDELKKIEINILDYIDKICNENDLKYFIAYGTLLGAVRHKGFIPWDDDMDICMPREDYNKFISLLKDDKNYKLISFETDPDYYFYFARVCDKNSKLILKNMREIHELGVFVDVFPVDTAPPEEKKEEWIKKCKLLRKKVCYTIPASSKYSKYTIKTILQIIKRFPFRILWGTRNFEKIREEYNNNIQKYNGQELKEYGVGGVGKYYNNDLFDDYTMLEFEGKKYRAPKKYDEVLKSMYGDYMTLPPEEERVTRHHFTPYYKTSNE